MYKFGLSTTVDYSVDIFTQLKLFKRAGFEFISLGADMNHSYFFNDSNFRRVLLLAEKNDLRIDSVHAPFNQEYDIAAVNPELRKSAIDKMAAFMARAVQFEIPTIIVHPHYYFQDLPEECLSRAIDSLEKLIGNKPHDIEIAIENLPRESGSWICDQLLNEFDKTKLGFCYDSSHENISGEPFHILRKHYNRMTTSHLSDNNGQFDEHLNPGDGTIDWAGLKSYFDKSSIRKVLFEIGTGKKLNEPIEGFIMKTARKAHEIFEN